MKATMVVFSSEVCSTFTAMSSRTLLSDQVMLSADFHDVAHKTSDIHNPVPLQATCLACLYPIILTSLKT
jgi:hypothetical protein